MQSGLGRPAAGARLAGICSQWGARVGALVLSLAASACANIGQIGNLTESQRITVAIESVDGPPAAVVQKFITALKDEAASNRITVVSSGEASYRLRGYLAPHADAGGSAIAWAWDVYDANARRAFRLSGLERIAAGERNRWAGADDRVLHNIARTGIDQFAGLATAGNSPKTAAVASPPPPQRGRLAWLDDWAPEASGIFRIFRSEPPRPEDAKTETALAQAHAHNVPLPRGRPAPSDTVEPPSEAAAESTLAFALPER